MTHHINWASLVQEQQANIQRAVDAAKAKENDLDEVRRLLYMTLCAPLTKRYNLAGTLVNALVHHAHLETDPEDLIPRVAAAVDGEGDPHWVVDHIGVITTRLDEGIPPYTKNPSA